MQHPLDPLVQISVFIAVFILFFTAVYLSIDFGLDCIPSFLCVCGGEGSLLALSQDVTQSLFFFISFSESYPFLVSQVSYFFISRMSSSSISTSTFLCVGLVLG